MTMQSTPGTAAFRSITPLIPAGRSLASALAFYTEQMGFSIVWEGGSMAGIARDDIALNLVENDNQAWAANASFSIGVSDLEALYQEYRHISAQVGPLETKPWGRQEFHLIAPSGVAFQFYHHQAV
jgi:hypothetical protein